MPDDTPNLPVPYLKPAAGPPEVSDLAAVAERIRSREMAVRAGLFAFLHNGADLSMMKRKLGHGAFLPWVEREFTGTLGWSLRSIERMMQAADEAGERIDRLADLGVSKTAIYAVTASSTPPQIKAAFFARIDAGDATAGHQAVRDIKEAKAEAVKVARRARMTPEAKAATEKAEAAARKRQERKLAEREAEEAERRAALEAAVAMLRDRLGEDVGRFLELADKASLNLYDAVRMLREASATPPVPVVEADEAEVEAVTDGAPVADVFPVEEAPPPEAASAAAVRASAPRRGAGSLDHLAGFKRSSPGANATG